MTTLLIITRYPRYLGIFGILSMAVFRLPLWMNKQVSFWKLMGCGKNGSFDIHPDWRQWAILAIQKDKTHVNQGPKLLGSFINGWLKVFHCEVLSFELEPLAGHGTWDGQKVFGSLPTKQEHNGHIAVLTRATIRLGALKHFWKNVAPVAARVAGSKGFIFSAGIGEVPWIRQATFSVWETKEAMQAFAYGLQEHNSVIKKTRQEKWYTEDMFVRFRIISVTGSLAGKTITVA